MVKELGKNTPVTSGEGGPQYRQPARPGQRDGVAQTSEKRLFTKNTGPCEVARRCIRTDACPVLEG